MLLDPEKTARSIAWFTSAVQYTILVTFPFFIQPETMPVRILAATAMLFSIGSLGNWLKTLEEELDGSPPA